METDDTVGKHGITRRECISMVGTATGGMALGVPLMNETAAIAEASSPTDTVTVDLRVNHQPYRMNIDPRVTLLDFLRERARLTGTKKGCDHGQCGACTVLVNGRRINSCLSLAVCHDGDEVTTIEGLAAGGTLDPIQSAFIEHDGFQCGYCTPGQICSAVAMLTEVARGDASFATADIRHPEPVELSDAEIRERMSGNICRCGAYPGIIAAVKTAGHVTQSADAKESVR